MVRQRQESPTRAAIKLALECADAGKRRQTAIFKQHAVALTRLGEKLGIKNLAGELKRAPESLAPILSAFRRILDGYDELDRVLGSPHPVVIDTTATIAHRVLYRLGPQLWGSGGAAGLTIGENLLVRTELTDVLIDNAGERRADFILTWWSEGRLLPDIIQEQFEEIAAVDLTRALIAPMRTRLDPVINWSQVTALRLAAMREPSRYLHLPWEAVESHYSSDQIDRVKWMMEAHALVLAGQCVTVTHREMLSEEEEKYTEACGLPDEMGRSKLVLLKRKASTANENEWSQVAANALQAIIADIKKRRETAQQINTWLHQYRYAWHTTMLPGRPPKRSWIQGEIELSATPAMFIKGKHRFAFQGDREFRVFGRVLSRERDHDATMHFLYRYWKTEDPLSEQGLGSCIMNERVEPMIGTWLGKYSLLPNFREGGGVLVLSATPLSPSMRDRLVKKWEKTSPMKFDRMLSD